MYGSLNGQFADMLACWLASWMHGRTDGWMNEQMDACMHGCMGGYVCGWMDGWMDRSIDRWIIIRDTKQMDGCIYGWKNELIPTSVRISTVCGIGTNPFCLGLPVDFPSVNIVNAFGTSGRSPPSAENNFSFANVSAKSVLVLSSSFKGISFIFSFN